MTTRARGAPSSVPARAQEHARNAPETAHHLTYSDVVIDVEKWLSHVLCFVVVWSGILGRRPSGSQHDLSYLRSLPQEAESRRDEIHA